VNYSASESLHALSGAYAVDALDDDERAAFEKHLAGCSDCQQEVAGLREATALLADDAALTPPAALRESVLAGIKTIRPLAPQVGRPTAQESDEPKGADSSRGSNVVPFRRRNTRIARLLVAAAAVLVVAGGVTWHPWQDNTTRSHLGAVDQVLNAADTQKVSMSFKDGSSATVYRSKSFGKAVLLTQDMAFPPAGKAFELWLRDKSGVMRRAGMMNTGGDHKLLLTGNAAQATGVGITVEPKGGSNTPSSAPIAMFELGQGSA
jgi:anti-sigma-K factor RskA